MTTNQPFLPYGRQEIDDDDIAAVVEVLRGNWLTTGPSVAAFEKRLADCCDAPDSVAVANGTAALHLAMLAAGIGPGDWVVVPSITFLASANAARYVGADVVFADVDPDSGLMTPETCAAAIGRAKGPVRAIAPVHLGGRLVDLSAIRKLADECGALVIEDACHALGGTGPGPEGTPEFVGTCVQSDMAVFSFHPVKTVTSGEGGAITFRNETFGAALRELRNHGMIRDPGRWTETDLAFTEGTPNRWYYEMKTLGFNYRLTDLQSALGESQLKKLPRFIKHRAALADRYDRYFSERNGRIRPAAPGVEIDCGRHLYQVHIDFGACGVSRETLMGQLQEKGIGTQVHYIPVHRQPYYRQYLTESSQEQTILDGADTFYRNSLSLPLFSTMSETDADYVAETLISLLDAA